LEAGGVSSAAGAVLLVLSAATCVIPISSTTGSADAGGGKDASVGGGDGAAPPSGNWTNVTSNLANMPSACGNMSYLSAKPDEDLLIAGIALDGLWASRDGGQSWSAFGVSDASLPITNATSAIVYDPTTSGRFWESGFHDVRGVFETTDDGADFIESGDVPHVDLVSIDFSDPNRQTLLAGGHEMAQTVNRSTDGGMTWTNVGGALPTNTDCSFPLVIDSMTHLVGCDGEGGGPIGIYRTTDGGASWTSATTLGGIYAPLVASDGSIYWSSPNGDGMARSTDKGQTWTNTGAAQDVLGSFRPIELPDGRIVTIGPEYGTQYVLASADHGATWNPVSAALPYADATAVAYSSQRKMFYIWHFSCVTQTDPVPTDAIMSFPFDYQKS
jgi:photosystem II stability/assembly factor-like uncharacterized protein